MSSPLRLLLIEDREDDAELLLRELRRSFVPTWERVQTAATLALALERPWDVVISDWALPELDAMAALALVKQRRPELPFIIVSGTIGEETAVAAMRAGAQDFLLKGKLARLVPAVERELRDATAKRVAQRTIEELSTPVLALRNGLLLLPLIGTIDATRARQLTSSLLDAVRAHRARVVVVDITGVPILDTPAAEDLVRAMEAARLLGATAVLAGVSSDVARSLPAELSKLSVVVDLRRALEEADRLLGYRLVRIEPEDEARKRPRRSVR